MAEVVEAARRFRRQLLAGEQAAADLLLTRYGRARAQIQAELRRLRELISDAKRNGERVDRRWLRQTGRLEALRRQVEREVGEYTRYASRQIIFAQREAVVAAERHAEQLALFEQASPRSVFSPWNRLPVEAVEQLIGALSEGSPVARLLSGLAGETADIVAQLLTNGVALGWNPRITNQMLNRALSVPAWRSLTIARTETLRAYREASRLTYEQNSDVVQSYVWVAALSRRTCAACLALHGQEFPLAEPFGTHPNCRCTLVPRLRGEANPVEETGEDWLSRQPAATAEVVLGRTGAAAWQDGAVGLSDFVGERQSAGYGVTRFARSAREVVGAHG